MKHFLVGVLLGLLLVALLFLLLPKKAETPTTFSPYAVRGGQEVTTGQSVSVG